MKLTRTFRATLLLMSWHISASAEKELKFAPMATLGADNDYVVLDMRCTGEQPFSKLPCIFTEIRISKPSQTKAQQERAELKANLEKMPESELSKTFTMNLDEFAKQKRTLLAPKQLKEYTPERLLAIKHEIDFTNSLLACSDKKSCIIDTVLNEANAETQTCLISTFQFSIEFQRIGPRKWLSNPGPQGICNLMNVWTLEHEPDDPLLWTFTQTRATIDKTNNPLCEGFIINKPAVYSWKAGKELMMDCKTIKFR